MLSLGHSASNSRYTMDSKRLSMTAFKAIVISAGAEQTMLNFAPRTHCNRGGEVVKKTHCVKPTLSKVRI